MPHAPAKLSRAERLQRDKLEAKEVFDLFNRLTGMQLRVDHRDAAVADLRRQQVLQAIEDIEKTTSFEHDHDKDLTLEILRREAALGPRPPASKNPGNKALLVSLNVRLAYCNLVVHRGISKTRASALLATECKVDVGTVKAALGSHMSKVCDDLARGVAFEQVFPDLAR